MWHRYREGKTLQTTGTENGNIIFDEENPDGARVTVEQGGRTAPFSITCGIYGWMVHTCFFTTSQHAKQAMVEIKQALEQILFIIPRYSVNPTREDIDRIDDSIAEFVSRFP